MSDTLSRTPKRCVLRLIVRDAYARVDQVIEQQIPASAHDIGLLLRRAPFRDAIAAGLLDGGTATIEIRGAK